MMTALRSRNMALFWMCYNKNCVSTDYVLIMDYCFCYYYYTLRRVRWVVHVALWRRGEVHTGFWWVNLRERDHLEESGIDWRIILKWIFKQ